MVEFRTLSKVKLERILQELIHFFYKKANVNIAVENAITKPKYKKFGSDVKKTLAKQINPYTDKKRIEEIITQVQKVEKRDIALAVATTFVVFQTAFPSKAKGIKAFLKWSAVIGALDALNKLGVSSPSFDPDGDETKKIINDRYEFFTKQIDNTTIAWIARNIELGIEQDMSSDEISEMISENMEETIDRRSDIIAEAELVAMIGLLTLLTFKKNGVEMVRWVVTPDEITCEICLGNEADGWIPLGEAFSSGHTTTPSHLRCRCFLEPKTKIDGRIWRG